MSMKIDIDVLNELGYTEPDEIGAIIVKMQEHKPPYQADTEEHVKWVEFIRAFEESDFSVGDTFILDGWRFKIE